MLEIHEYQITKCIMKCCFLITLIHTMSELDGHTLIYYWVFHFVFHSAGYKFS